VSKPVSSPSISIDWIEITIKDTTVCLTVDEVRQLAALLDDLLGKAFSGSWTITSAPSGNVTQTG